MLILSALSNAFHLRISEHSSDLNIEPLEYLCIRDTVRCGKFPSSSHRSSTLGAREMCLKGQVGRMK